MLALIDELHASGRTIIVITHEAEVGERADRIIHVRDGLVFDDSDSVSPSSAAIPPIGHPESVEVLG